MFATFDRSGVSFAYPENWLLEEEQDDDAKLYLTVSSPNTAFWTLIVYGDTLDLPHVVDQALGALRQEYPDLETNPADESVEGVALTGTDANFICLDLTSTTRARACHRGGSTYLILSQAEDRELESVDAVFAAINKSLLTGETPGDGPSIAPGVLPE